MSDLPIRRAPNAHIAPPGYEASPMPEVSPEWTAELKKGSIQLCLLALLAKGEKYGFQNPFDLSRSSRRIWNPYFSPLARRASKHSWIEPFFSSAVHSGETSGIGLASYPRRAIWPFGARRLREVGHRSPGVAMFGTSSSTHHRGKKRKRKGRRAAHFGVRRARVRK